MTDLRGVGGVWPASITPFDSMGNLDEVALRAHLRDLATTPGVRAVVVNGHAGEATSLNREERIRIIRAAREAADPAIGIVAGVLADDTRAAWTAAMDAEEAGANALLLFPPPLFALGAALRPEMVLRFVSDVARATRLPIVLFQLSRASGLAYGRDTLTQLCQDVPSIIAIKEGTDIPEAYEENLLALRALERKVTLLTTNNSWLFSSLSYGADGILSGLGCVAAPLLVELFAAMQAGDLARARAANACILPLVRVFYRAPALDTHNRMKTALHLLGKLPCPDPRLPLFPITAAERQEIQAALEVSGLLAA